MELKDKKISCYIKDGNLEIEKIISDYTNYIYTIINNFNIVLTEEDIEEIISETFFTLWNNKPKLDWNSNMSPYLAGIAKNLIKRRYKDIIPRENIENYEEKLVSKSNIELDYIQKEGNVMLLKELNKLKDEDKNIFILYYYEDESIKEISKNLNISESKVKIRLFRTRKKLKKILKIRGYDCNE